MRLLSGLILMLLLITNVEAKYSILGKVENKNLKTPLSEVNIYFKNNPKIGTATTESGEYKLIVPSDFNFPDTLIFSYTGFKPKQIPVHGNINPYYLDIDLKKENFLLETIYYEEKAGKIDLVFNYGHCYDVTGVDVTTDLSLRVTADKSGLIKLWNKDNNLLRNFNFWKKDFVNENISVFFTENEKNIIAASKNRVKIYTLNGELVYENIYRTNILKTQRKGKYFGLLTEQFLHIYDLRANNTKLFELYKKELQVGYEHIVRNHEEYKTKYYSKLNFNMYPEGDDIYYSCNDNYHNIYIFKNIAEVFIGKLNNRIHSHYYDVKNSILYIGFDGFIQQYKITASDKCELVKLENMREYFKRSSVNYKYLPVRSIEKIKDDKLLINIGGNTLLSDFNLDMMQFYRVPVMNQFIRNSTILNILESNDVMIADDKNLWFPGMQENINLRKPKKINTFKRFNDRFNFVIDDEKLCWLSKKNKLIPFKNFKNYQDSVVYNGLSDRGLFTINQKKTDLSIIKESKIEFMKKDIQDLNYNAHNRYLSRYTDGDSDYDFETSSTEKENKLGRFVDKGENLFLGAEGHAKMKVHRYGITGKKFKFNCVFQDIYQKDTDILNLEFFDNSQDDIYYVPKYDMDIIRNDFTGFKISDFTKTGNNSYRIAHSYKDAGINIIWEAYPDSINQLDIRKIRENFFPGMNMLKLSDDGNLLAIGYYTGQVNLYSLKDKKMTLIKEMWDLYNPVKALNFQSNNYLTCADRSGKIILYNIKNNVYVQKAFNIKDENFKISEVIYNAKNEMLFVLNKEGDILIRNLKLRKENWLRMFFTEKGEVFAYNNEGYFYCPKKSMNNIYYVEGVNILAEKNMHKKYYTENLLENLL